MLRMRKGPKDARSVLRRAELPKMADCVEEVGVGLAIYLVWVAL